MAINPKVVSNQELGELDLVYIRIWEQHIDFMLTAIRDRKNENEFYKNLTPKIIISDADETEEKPTYHRADLNELFVNISGIKSKYGDDADSKIFLALDRLILLKDGSQIFWNPLFSGELIRRYKEAGWADVEYKIGGIPDPDDKEYCTIQYFLVFTPPDKSSEPAAERNTATGKTVTKSQSTNSRAGWVYLLKAENGFYKIGRSKNPRIRVSAITKAVAPFEIEEIHKAFYTDCVKAEKELHEKFKDKRQRGEWFALTLEDVKAVIEHQYEAV
jgi:hypothetical protein